MKNNLIHLNKKIIAFDLDGTLAESKQHLESDISKLICSLAKSVSVAIISGGSMDQFKKQFLPYLLPEKEYRDIIFRNLILLPTSGSRRYQYDEERSEWLMTDEEAMPAKIREKILKVLKDFIASNTYGIAPAIEGDNIIEDRVTQITMSALGQHAPLLKKKIWDPHQEKRQKIKKELEEKLPDVSINIGGSTSIDILPKGFNKATGLLRLLNKLNIDISDMVFVGDAIFPGGNDYSPYEAGIECVKVSGPAETEEVIKKWLM